jgi:hypothetical protein
MLITDSLNRRSRQGSRPTTRVARTDTIALWLAGCCPPHRPAGRRQVADNQFLSERTVVRAWGRCHGRVALPKSRITVLVGGVW